MPLYDLPLDELQHCRPPQTKEPDFEDFWAVTLQEAAPQPLDPELVPTAYPARGVTVHSASYTGWRGARIHG
jgi:cephalosporin-C deacetylase